MKISLVVLVVVASVFWFFAFTNQGMLLASIKHPTIFPWHSAASLDVAPGLSSQPNSSFKFLRLVKLISGLKPYFIIAVRKFEVWFCFV
jgi:hypothetical protein